MRRISGRMSADSYVFLVCSCEFSQVKMKIEFPTISTHSTRVPSGLILFSSNLLVVGPDCPPVAPSKTSIREDAVKLPRTESHRGSAKNHVRIFPDWRRVLRCRRSLEMLATDPPWRCARRRRAWRRGAAWGWEACQREGADRWLGDAALSS